MINTKFKETNKMNLKIVFTYFSILSFSSTIFLTNLKAYEKNSLSTSKYLAKNEKSSDYNYESQYILGSGDLLLFNFETLPGFNSTQEIDQEGNVTLTELDRIQIIGLTINEAEKLLNKKYEEFIYKPNIKIKLLRYRPISVYLRGEVKNPGLYSFPGYKLGSDNDSKRARLFDVLKIAKGVTNYADLTNITVIRDNQQSNGGGKIKTELNLLTMLINGEQFQNIDLFDNDNILVKKSPKFIKDQILAINKSNLSPEVMTVYVTGNVVSGGPLQISKGSSLIQALASSGGKKMLTGKIEFLRFNDDGTNKFDSFRYDPSAPVNSRKNPILMQGDVINVNKTILGKTTSVLKEITNPLFTGLGLYKVLED